MSSHKQPQVKNRQYAKYVKKALLSLAIMVFVMLLLYILSILLFGTITEKFSKFSLGVAITILIGMWAPELFQGGTKR
jgi:predicted Na+-dependent transporter